MPKKPKGKDKSSEVVSPRGSTGAEAYIRATQPSDSAMLAAPAHARQTIPSRSHASRPRLPSLSHIQTGSQLTPSHSSASTASYSGHSSHVPLSQYTSPSTHQTFSAFGARGRSPDALPFRSSEIEHYARQSAADPGLFPPPQGQSYNPLKRGYETTSSNNERSHYGTVPYPIATGDISEHRGYPYSSSASNTSTPTTMSHPIMGHPRAYSSGRSNSSTTASRFSLHMRQQPRAARAGPDGKDRRPIDPPPVLQLLMQDFNINDESEVEELQSRCWVVYCRLVSANSPRREMSTLVSPTEDGQREIQRLLLGTTVASPFLTKDDPDPARIPLHPISEPEPEAPPSPTSRFLPSSRANPPRSDQAQPHLNPRAGSTPATPATFFIFADISVRKAGDYRLEFSLMHMDDEALRRPGSNVPIICNIASQVFKVVNAKDFDQVKASTELVRGLVERGAGFPLKLKKGTRAGEGRRGEGQSQSDDENSEDNGD